MNLLKIPKWLFLTLLLVFLLRIPSFFEPYYYGDEMIYMTLGNGIRKGLTLYKDIYDNKPPLLYFTAAISFGYLFWFKATLLLANFLGIFVFWKLIKILFKPQNFIVIFSTIIFSIFSTIPLLEGNIVNAEHYVILFSLLGYLTYFGIRKKTKYIYFLIGVFFSVSSLYKIPAVFDLIALLTFIIFFDQEKRSKKYLINIFILILGFLSLHLLFSGWYLYKNALFDYIKSAYIQNVFYLSSFRPDDASKSFIIRNAPLIFRGFILTISIILLYIKGKKLNKNFIFISIYLVFSLFAVALSERPYPHYLIQALPPISVLFAILFFSKKYEQLYAIPLLFLALAIPYYYKFYNYQTGAYYLNFVKFSLNNINKEQFFNYFDKNVNRNYKIANHINNIVSQNEKIFIWGDSPTIYAITRKTPSSKYTASYHIIDYSNEREIIDELRKNKTNYIIILPYDRDFPLLETYSEKNSLVSYNFEDVKIWKIKE